MSGREPAVEKLLSAALALVRDRGATGEVVDAVDGENMGYVEVETDAGDRAAGTTYMPAGPSPELVGRDALAVVEDAIAPDASNPTRAMGLATLNALSEGLVEWRRGDPMAALTDDVDTVAMVGLFGPVLREFEELDVRVIERDPGAVSLPDDLPPSVDVSLHGQQEAEPALDGADVVLVTGTTLVYGGLGRYLAATSADQPFVLVGATSSFVPEPLFEAGTSVVAGARVTDRERVRDLIAGPRCGQKLHGNGLQKVYTRPSFDHPLPGLALDGGSVP